MQRQGTPPAMPERPRGLHMEHFCIVSMGRARCGKDGTEALVASSCVKSSRVGALSGGIILENRLADLAGSRTRWRPRCGIAGRDCRSGERPRERTEEEDSFPDCPGSLFSGPEKGPENPHSAWEVCPRFMRRCICSCFSLSSLSIASEPRLLLSFMAALCLRARAHLLRPH